MIGEIEGIKVYVNDETYAEYKKTLQDEIKQLQEENKQLKDNWNKLREFLENNWKKTQDIWFVKIINKMQELERGDNNVKD